MTVNQLRKYFGSIVAAAKAIGLDRACIYKWISSDYIPHERQLQYEKLSEGKLIAERLPMALPAYRYFDPSIGMCLVKSLTFSAQRPPQISYKSNQKGVGRRYTYNPTNLMQATHFIDSSGLNLFEKDIIVLNEKEVQVGDLHQIYVFHDEFDLIFSSFKIIGNTFEGVTYGHKDGHAS